MHSKKKKKKDHNYLRMKELRSINYEHWDMVMSSPHASGEINRGWEAKVCWEVHTTLDKGVKSILHDVPSLTSSATACLALSTLSFTLASFSSASVMMYNMYVCSMV